MKTYSLKELVWIKHNNLFLMKDYEKKRLND